MNKKRRGPSAEAAPIVSDWQVLLDQEEVRRAVSAIEDGINDAAAGRKWLAETLRRELLPRLEAYKAWRIATQAAAPMPRLPAMPSGIREADELERLVGMLLLQSDDSNTCRHVDAPGAAKEILMAWLAMIVATPKYHDAKAVQSRTNSKNASSGRGRRDDISTLSDWLKEERIYRPTGEELNRFEAHIHKAAPAGRRAWDGLRAQRLKDWMTQRGLTRLTSQQEQSAAHDLGEHPTKKIAKLLERLAEIQRKAAAR